MPIRLIRMRYFPLQVESTRSPSFAVCSFASPKVVRIRDAPDPLYC
jgi:hypothetical protein